LRIGIVGGGAVGVAAAHAFLDEGHAVTMFDPRGFAGGASGGNAGWIAHVDVLPLASSKAWRSLPGWLADPLGPLAIRPSYLPRLAPWLFRFLLASRPRRIRAGMEALTALNRLAVPAWERRLASLRLERHLHRRGALHVWTSRADFAAAAPTIRYQDQAGIPVRLLEGPELRAFEPALGDKLVAGAFYETGCHVSDPRQLVVALGEAALGRGAVLERQPVAAVLPGPEGMSIVAEGGGRRVFDRVLIAAGAWSKPLARALGDRIPLDTERGYNVTFPSGQLGLTRPVAFEGQGFVATPLNTGDRIGGAVEFGGLDAAPNYSRVDAFLSRLKPLLPDANLSGGERWMGFRPSIPDSLPVIGPSSADGRVLYAFGHGHYGLTQATATAEFLAALLASRSLAMDIAPFSPRRFRLR
jgi:D-amino-acid dehydrogenase